MEWKLEEDIICCEVCVYEYVICKNDMNIKSCIEKIKQHASICNREVGSIRQRIQNIKYCIEKLCIENTIPVSPLSHAGSQTKQALTTCLINASVIQSTKEE